MRFHPINMINWSQWLCFQLLLFCSWWQGSAASQKTGGGWIPSGFGWAPPQPHSLQPSSTAPFSHRDNPNTSSLPGGMKSCTEAHQLPATSPVPPRSPEATRATGACSRPGSCRQQRGGPGGRSCVLPFPTSSTQFGFPHVFLLLAPLK